MSNTSGSPALAQPGIFRGHVLSTPLGFVPQAKAAAVVQFVMTNASLATVHEVRMVMEGRLSINELSKAALAEMRRLAVQYLRG